MGLIEVINGILSAAVMPAVLMGGGVYMTIKLRGFWMLHPVRFCRRLKEAGGEGGTSPVKALTVALAGTLGVGNMAGVATAITAGGAGAVFWMWFSAICAMAVKYTEVSLAVHFRRKSKESVSNAASSIGENGSAVRYHGGAMYYIRELWGDGAGGAAAVIFAVLLCVNSLLTGNIIQVNAAASVFPEIPPIVAGAVFAALMLYAGTGGGKRIMRITSALVPALTAVFTALSLYVIIKNASLLPGVLHSIIKSAFDFSGASEGGGIRSIFGGILGSSASRAIRYGVTRGIFSNEAGCGTSPTAHAAANTKSPHHQGCFGIFEVFADTIALCSLTAFVLLMAPAEGDGIPRTMSAYAHFAGSGAGYAIGISVILFALATVLCQCYYGMEAVEYIRCRLFPRSSQKTAIRLYCALSAAACTAGAVISADAVWSAADLIISLMTAINVICVIPGVSIALSDMRRAEPEACGSPEARVSDEKAMHRKVRMRFRSYAPRNFLPQRHEISGTNPRTAAPVPRATAGRQPGKAVRREL